MQQHYLINAAGVNLDGLKHLTFCHTDSCNKPVAVCYIGNKVLTSVNNNSGSVSHLPAALPQVHIRALNNRFLIVDSPQPDIFKAVGYNPKLK